MANRIINIPLSYSRIFNTPLDKDCCFEDLSALQVYLNSGFGTSYAVESDGLTPDDNKLNEIINKIKSIKTTKELLNVHKEIIRMNYSIKNIIKQILVFNNNDSLNELLNSNITDEFLLFGLIKILNE